MTDNIRTRPQPRCYLCESEGYFLYRELDDFLFDVPGRWNLRKCPDVSCGLIWLDPVPVEADTGKIYRSYHTHENYDGRKKARSLPHRGRRAFKNLAITLGLIKHKLIVDNVIEHFKPGNELLEVGCGRGEILHRMSQRGWQVHGVDSDEEACAYALKKYGLNIFPGTLEAAAYPDESFDAVLMNHVIEHVHDPLNLLNECWRVLRPQGKLAMVTPNHESLGHGVFKQDWRGLEPPRHFYLFSQATLKKLTKRANFSQISTCTVPSHAFSFFSDSIAISDKNELSRQRRRMTVLIQALLLQYYEMMAIRADKGVGEEAILLCQK